MEYGTLTLRPGPAEPTGESLICYGILQDMILYYSLNIVCYSKLRDLVCYSVVRILVIIQPKLDGATCV